MMVRLMAGRLNGLVGKYNALPVTVRAATWFLVCSFLQKGIAFITTPIFTRLLTTEEYGQYSVFMSWQGIATAVVTLNLAAGVFTQGLVKFEEDRDIFVSALQGLALTLTLAWTVVYFLLRDFWNRLLGLTTAQMLAMLVIVWATTVYGFWAIEQRVYLKYRRLVALTLATSIARPLLGVLLVIHSEDKVTARILGMALVDVIAYAGLFVSHIRRGRVFCSREYWKYALLFNLPLLPHYLSVNVLSSADRIMVSNMVGASQAGIYSLAYSISQIMMMFNTALFQTTEPWMYRKMRDKRVEDIAQLAYPCFCAIAIVNLALIALAPEAIAVFAPPEYSEAIYVVPPVAMGVFFSFCYSFFAVFEFYFEKTAYITAATVGGAVLNVLLNWILIPVFGYVVAGYTTLVCYMAFALFHYWFMTRICRESLGGAKVYDLRIIVGLSSVFIIVGFALMLTYSHAIIRYVTLAAFVIALVVFHDKLVSFAKKIASVRGMKEVADQ